jgi:hypothetical protein
LPRRPRRPELPPGKYFETPRTDSSGSPDGTDPDRLDPDGMDPDGMDSAVVSSVITKVLSCET